MAKKNTTIGKAKKKTQLGQSTDFSADLKGLGNRMKQLRIKKGYSSFETFAYDHDLPRVLYGNYEKGEGNITYKNLMKVIYALGVSVKEFYSEGFD